MWMYSLRRILYNIPIFLAIVFVMMAALRIQNPVYAYLGKSPTPEEIAAKEHEFGLDRPFLVQYGSWLWNAVQGDLSRSLASGEEVAVQIARSFPNTLLIVVMAMGFALLFGIPLGILAASRPHGIVDRVVTSIGSLGIAVPNFWLAMILVAWFSLEFGWFPATGAVPLAQDPAQAIWHAFLPALALASGGLSEVSRQLRSSLVEVMSSPQVRTLHAKGLTPASILWKHGLKNVSVNLLTVCSLLFNRMLAATVVVEAVFAIPGMGSLIVNAALFRDLPVAQGVVFVMVLVVITVNLVTDLLYTVLDPRIR